MRSDLSTPRRSPAGVDTETRGEVLARRRA